MRLYYFTGRSSLPEIARHGIPRTDLVPVKDTGASGGIRARHKGVWLTTDPNPIVYTPPSVASKDQQIAFAYGAQRQAIRFAIDVADDDPKLVHWFEWGRKVLDADLYRRVDEILRRDRHTRWLYLDTVRKSQLSDPYDFEVRKPLSGWLEESGAGPEIDAARFDVMDLDDPGWARLQGADRRPYDPRAALRALERSEATTAVWAEFWTRLYRQGEVAEASYAVVPHLVRIHAARGVTSWNTYALIAAIEQARQDGRNPDLPENLRGPYRAAWRRLVELALVELGTAEHPRLVSSLLAAVAVGKGQFDIGRFAMLADPERARLLAEPRSAVKG